MRDVKFAACLDGEVAWESDGHGEFTLRATQILSAGVQGMSNEQFARRITEAFGPDARQHPMLDCVEGAAALGLLQPLVRADGPSPIASAPAAARVDEALLHQTLLSLQQLLARLPAR